MDPVSLTPPPLQPHAFIDGVPAFAWSALHDGSLELANQACLDYLGLSLDQVRADWQSLLHPDDKAESITWWEELQKSGQPGQTEARWRRADGEYRWFQQSVAPVHDERGLVIRWYGVNVDIDDRKRAEQQLWQSEENLRAITDAVRQLIVVLAPDGTTLYANKVALENTGFTLRDLTDQRLLCGPFIQAAVRVQSMGDDDDAVRFARWLPRAREDLEALDAFEAAFSHVVAHCSFLEVWGGRLLVEL